MALGFRNQHLRTANCEETVFSVTRFENRIQTALIFSFSGTKFFLYTSLLIGHWHLQHRC